jgi:hypothetical protein
MQFSNVGRRTSKRDSLFVGDELEHEAYIAMSSNSYMYHIAAQRNTNTCWAHGTKSRDSDVRQQRQSNV